MDATEGTSENASQRVPDGESETVNEMPPRPRTCGSCRFWDVRIGRSRALENSVAYCALPAATFPVSQTQPPLISTPLLLPVFRTHPF
jgi:hypothetical protein